ncbi:phosphoribosylamine--glycine ligase [Paracraurococcus lichenis]|uniref:Phosphoribosylamine--glycine ligase n=1 Tax=Paracraurococcus lichenis TaxID=3064888 RepID=A0ABT9DUI5_9PROT|nr:phosphoribosylamine--glycine ligase [Paracraurococcus sp. LOR1-02]MDO9707557.1 phosphoribosylamine--glycine ligase [Paracraurococcus sp. LOR1-02]
MTRLRPLRPLALAGLLALAACSAFRAEGPPLPPEQDTAEHRACRAEARNSPEMKAVGREFYAGNQGNIDRVTREEQVAFNRAYRDCLRARGLGMPGGVEPVVRR